MLARRATRDPGNDRARATRPTRTPADPALWRTVTAAAVGGLLLAVTLLKHGSYINVFAVAEPPLLVIAIVGALLLWRTGRTSARAGVALLAALLAAQSLSLLVSPASAVLARRPFARSGLAQTLSPAAVSRAVALARRCPASEAYSGPAYIAFLADRRMPGDQPDLFMLRYASADRVFAQRAAADEPRCPA